MIVTVVAQQDTEPATFVKLMSRMLIVAVSVTASLAALEGAVRLYGRLTNQPRGMTFDEDLGWRPVPNVQKIGAVWGVSRPASTNSHGWRDREHSYEKAPGVRRVVAIGDSFTFGTDVDDGERFSDLLDHRFNHVEVINLGVAGYGTDQELRLLETVGFRYQPDIVILTVCVLNDLDDIGYERLYSWPKPYYSLMSGPLQLWRPEKTWDIRVRTSSDLVEFAYQRLMKETNNSRRGAKAATDTMPVFAALIDRFVGLTARHGARLLAVLAYGPEGVRGDFTMLGRHITEVFARLGVPTLDTRMLFATQSQDPNKLLYSSVGLHWNARGHAVVADGIAQLMHDIGLPDSQ
jgi:lysophospholipase L1-like esterase